MYIFPTMGIIYVLWQARNPASNQYKPIGHCMEMV